MKNITTILILILTSVAGCTQNQKEAFVSTSGNNTVEFEDKEYKSLHEFEKQFNDWIRNEIKSDPNPIIEFHPNPNSKMEFVNQVKDVLKAHHKVIQIAVESKEGAQKLVKFPPKINKKDLPHYEVFKERNLLRFYISEIGIFKDSINGELIDLEMVESLVLSYILSDGSNPTLPEYTYYSSPEFGKIQAARKLITTITPTIDTKFADYQKLKWEIQSAFKNARNNKSKELFNKAYDELNDNDRKMIKNIIPIVISELPSN